MFDIGFSELLIIAIVALVVLGPERLPKAARFAGLWVRRARAQWYSVKAEFERDLAADEMRRSMQDARDAMRGIDDSVRQHDADLRREFDAMREQMRTTGAPPDAAPDAGPPAGAAEANAGGDATAGAPQAVGDSNTLLADAMTPGLSTAGAPMPEAPPAAHPQGTLPLEAPPDAAPRRTRADD